MKLIGILIFMFLTACQNSSDESVPTVESDVNAHSSTEFPGVFRIESGSISKVEYFNSLDSSAKCIQLELRAYNNKQFKFCQSDYPSVSVSEDLVSILQEVNQGDINSKNEVCWVKIIDVVLADTQSVAMDPESHKRTIGLIVKDKLVSCK